MRAFIHAFQEKPWNEECKAAYDGFKKLGIECLLFTSNEELDQRMGIEKTRQKIDRVLLTDED